MKEITVRESLSGIAVAVPIYGNAYLVLDGYGFGIETGNGRCNRVIIDGRHFASDYALNKTCRAFLCRAITNGLTGKMLALRENEERRIAV